MSSIAAYSVCKVGTAVQIAWSCAWRSLEAATSSMALVICLVLSMLLMRVLISFVDTAGHVRASFLLVL